MLPQDPAILLSFVNTRLRDRYAGLDELCGDLDVDRDELVRRLGEIHYAYSEARNQFV